MARRVGSATVGLGEAARRNTGRPDRGRLSSRDVPTAFEPAQRVNLRNVPDDEADDVRAMLDARGIPFYETRPSLWGVSAGGIWVTDDAAYAEARQAMDDYQRQRRDRARAEYAAARRAGTADTFMTLLRADPVRVVMSVLGILLVLVLVALPVVLLRR